MKIVCDYGDMPEVPREDYDEEKSDKAYKGCFWSLVASIVMSVIVSVLLLTSCTTTKVVEVEKVRTDTTYITKWQRDSVWLHDSIRVMEKGDSVWVERWHTKFIEREVHDTLYQAKTDSIPVPYWKIKEVPAELSWWQKLRLWLGNIVLLALLGVAVYYGYRFYKVWRFRL
jgi:hypothetical protein